jgi:hypothetical protein
MSNDFLIEVTNWDYASLAKLAKVYGGPQKLINVIYKAGRASDVKVAIIVASVTGATVGIATFVGVLKLLTSRREKKLKNVQAEQETIND